MLCFDFEIRHGTSSGNCLSNSRNLILYFGNSESEFPCKNNEYGPTVHTRLLNYHVLFLLHKISDNFAGNPVKKFMS